jgi:hypothetical protein
MIGLPWPAAVAHFASPPETAKQYDNPAKALTERDALAQMAETAKQYDNAAKALTERDALAQMLGDDSLTVRQIAPVGNVVIARGAGGGGEHRINWGAVEWQP